MTRFAITILLCHSFNASAHSAEMPKEMKEYISNLYGVSASIKCKITRDSKIRMKNREASDFSEYETTIDHGNASIIGNPIKNSLTDKTVYVFIKNSSYSALCQKKDASSESYLRE